LARKRGAGTAAHRSRATAGTPFRCICVTLRLSFGRKASVSKRVLLPSFLTQFVAGLRCRRAGSNRATTGRGRRRRERCAGGTPACRPDGGGGRRLLAPDGDRRGRHLGGARVGAPRSHRSQHRRAQRPHPAHDGDVLLVELGSVVEAVQCAVELQRAMSKSRRAWKIWRSPAGSISAGRCAAGSAIGCRSSFARSACMISRTSLAWFEFFALLLSAGRGPRERRGRLAAGRKSPTSAPA
jgi:hypothetical protein